MRIKEIAIILSIFAIITGSCKQVTKQSGAEITGDNVSELTEIVSEECEGNFTHKTFHTVLQQLSLKCSEVYLQYVSEQVLPANGDLTIWVIPKIDFLEKDEYGNESFNLDSYILLADTKTGKIVSKYYKPVAWGSDAYRLIDIRIDTLDFRLNDERIQFGIRTAYRADSYIFPTGDSFLELFVRQADSLVSVFQYATNSYHGETNGISTNGWLEEYNTELFVTDYKIKGFSDFALLTEYRMKETEDDEVIQDIFSNDSIRFYTYMADGYTEVNKIKGTYCREIKDGYGKRECFYFGKTLPEIYQLIYDENKENLQQYMLSELPLENFTYSIEAKQGEENDSLTIYYDYRTKKYLVIEFTTDFGSQYTAFEEKEGYTLFRYDYHD